MLPTHHRDAPGLAASLLSGAAFYALLAVLAGALRLAGVL